MKPSKELNEATAVNPSPSKMGICVTTERKTQPESDLDFDASAMQNPGTIAQYAIMIEKKANPDDVDDE